MGMNIDLTPQLEAMVREKVDSGLYASASDVVQEALRLMAEQDRMPAAILQQLREALQSGLYSGKPAAWDAEEMKKTAHARKHAKLIGG